MDAETCITHHCLRMRDFRIESRGVDPHVHMLLFLDNERALEISENCLDGWTVWIRCRNTRKFCYLQTVTTRQQLDELITVLTGEAPRRSHYNYDEFQQALEQEQTDCRRRYHEYASGHRHGKA